MRKSLKALVNHYTKTRKPKPFWGGALMVGVDILSREQYKNKASKLYTDLNKDFAVILYSKDSESPEIRSFESASKSGEFYDFARSTRKDVVYIALFNRTNKGEKNDVSPDPFFISNPIDDDYNVAFIDVPGPETITPGPERIVNVPGPERLVTATVNKQQSKGSGFAALAVAGAGTIAIAAIKHKHR